MSSCPACAEHVKATARFCRMCGHPLALTQASAATSEVSPGGELVVQDETYEDSVTLSYGADLPGAPVAAGSADGGGARTSMSAIEAADHPVCEICGQTASKGEALCGACAQLIASNERDDG